jgi:hypothetical protein
LNVNKLPTIISRLSLSNFYKKIKNNKVKDIKERNNMGIVNKLNIFHKTSIIGFKGIPIDNGIVVLRNTNYNINNPNNHKLLNLHKEINKYKIPKEEKLNQNNINIINKINSYNNNKDNKEMKKFHINNNINNVNQINNKIILFDSFLNELNVIFSNFISNNNSQQQLKNYENYNNNDSDDDKEPDPRINFEQINEVLYISDFGLI